MVAGTQELYAWAVEEARLPSCQGTYTDAGREFDNAPFKKWCLQRGISGRSAEHQSNGRAEAMIASIKQQVRRRLHGSNTPTRWWPAAARHVTELEQRRRENIKEKLPRFGQLITARKRAWERGGPFEVTSEHVTYLTLHLRHAVLTDKEKVKVVSYLIKDAIELEEVHVKEDPICLRWRLREKTPLACIQGAEELEVEDDRRQPFQAIYEEGKHMLFSAPRELQGA